MNAAIKLIGLFTFLIYSISFAMVLSNEETSGLKKRKNAVILLGDYLIFTDLTLIFLTI